jgi:tRNA pseudouridine55 synthase
MNDKDGLILLNKAAGITSFSSLGSIKKSLGIEKVGHSGTLDKFAEGLLLVLTGRFTGLAPHFSSLDKEYIAVLRFGEETDTLDPEGKIVQTAEAPSLEAVEEVLKHFIGQISQIPPVYSAVHYQGKRSYRLAREGCGPKLPSRQVTIHRLEIEAYNPPELTFTVRCSKGTYVRSLARDIGLAAASCAYLTALTRTAQGAFLLTDAVRAEDFQPEKNMIRADVFVPKLPGLQRRVIKHEFEKQVRNGIPVKDSVFIHSPVSDGNIAVFSRLRELLAVVNRQEGHYKYLKVFAAGKPY